MGDNTGYLEQNQKNTTNNRHTNDRCQVRGSWNNSLRRPIFSIGGSNVISPQIGRFDNKDKTEDKIPKKNKSKSQELVYPTIPLDCPEKEDFEPIKYIDHKYHNTPGNNTPGKYVIKIPRFDSCALEEWIIFVDLVQKTLARQNVTTGLRMYKYMERILKGDAKAEFTQQANLVKSCTVGNFTTVKSTVTKHIFPVLAYQDEKRYVYWYLRKSKTMKVCSFTTRLIHLNNYLPYFPPNHIGQMVTDLPDDEVKEILYHTMPNLWRKKMNKQEYNYLDMSIQ